MLCGRVTTRWILPTGIFAAQSKKESSAAPLVYSAVTDLLFVLYGKTNKTLFNFLCPISDGIFGLLQDFIHGPVSCAPFPNQSAFIQHSYDGCAVAIPPDFDPPILDPASDIGVLFSEAIARGVLHFGGLFGRWWRRIDQMETKGNRMFTKPWSDMAGQVQWAINPFEVNLSSAR